MEFLSKEFCRLTGLKSDTLRYYVDQKLLNPQVIEENQYKIYSEQDLMDLYYVRKCRNLEIPIRQIQEMQDHKNLEEQFHYLEQYRQSLEEEIHRLQLQLHGCSKMHRDIVGIPKLMKNVIETTTGPDVAQLDILGPGVEFNDKKAAVIQAWTRDHPVLFPLIKIRLEDILDEEQASYPVIMGLALAMREPMEVFPPAYVFPSSHSIGTMVRLADPFTVTREDLQPLYEYAKEHGYVFCSDMTSWLITKSCEQGVDYYYFALRISVSNQ